MKPEIELEYKIIGSVLLLDEEPRAKILSLIGEEYFSDTSAKEIYTKLTKICKEYPLADYTVLIAALDKAEQTSAVSAMSAMISPAIAEKSLDDTLNALRELYARRKIKNSVLELSLENEIAPGQLRQLVSEAETLTKKETLSSAENYLMHYSDPVKLLPTGFEGLDNILGGGLMEGTLSTIGARPSTGKTTYAINIAAHNPDKKIIFFSLEMSARMIYDRLIADVANIDYGLAGRHLIEFETAKAVVEKYRNLTVIDDVVQAEKIAEIIYCEKPEIVIVDFVQIITSRNKFVDNRQRIDYISQILKQAAKATGCCIITLSQITRAGKDKPTMSDLKESGGLEQDSDYVLLLHRPYVNDKSNPEADPYATTVTLDKNKFGSTREFKYSFDGKYQRFTELADLNDDIARPKSKEITANDDLPF